MMEYNPTYIYFESIADMTGLWCIAADSVCDIKSILAEDVDSIKGKLVQIKEADDVCCFPFSTTSVNFSDASLLCPYKFVYVDPAFQDMMRDEKVLKWTDLKIGDVIRSKVNRNVFMQVQGIDKSDDASDHIFAGGGWKSDDDLADWEKVEG